VVTVPELKIQLIVVSVKMPSLIHPLTHWRHQHHVTQEELSQLTGLSQQEISLIERWRRIPRGEALERLLSHTSLPTDALVRPRQFLAANPQFLRRTH
jgi:transcriptional regulator with XRE-family HTH domain